MVPQIAGDVPPPSTAELGASEWWSAFLQSGGLAGTAAVLAAVVGLVATWWTVRASRAEARAERDRATDVEARTWHLRVDELARAEWWRTYIWVVAHRDDIAERDMVRLMARLRRRAPDGIACSLARLPWTSDRAPTDEENADADRPRRPPAR